MGRNKLSKPRKMEKYLSKVEDGKTISYQEIEKGTGIEMDSTGKKAMDIALRKLNKPYKTIWGMGIKIGKFGKTKTVKDTVKFRPDHSPEEVAFLSMDKQTQKEIMFVAAECGCLKLTLCGEERIYNRI